MPFGKLDCKLFKEINQLIRGPVFLLLISIFRLVGTVSFLTLLQNIFCPPLCLYVHLDCPGHFSRGSCWLLFRGEVGTSLAAVRLLRWPCCLDPSLGTTSERAGPPQASLPIQALAQRCCIGETQIFQPPKGSDFQRLFCEQGLLISSADVRPAHPLPCISRCSSDLLRPARKPSQTVPSFWGHSFCLERGDARAEEGNREREREEGEEKGKKRQGEAARGPEEDPPAS